MKKILLFLLFVLVMASILFSPSPRAALRSVWASPVAQWPSEERERDAQSTDLTPATDALAQSPIVRGVLVEDGYAITYFDDPSLLEYAIPAEYDGKPVVEISDGAFAECNLSLVRIPACVKRIGKNAFCDSANLERVEMFEGVELVGDAAFQGCDRLEIVTLPSTVKEIGAAAFAECSSLTTLEIPRSVEKIGQGAFENCPVKLYVYSDSYAESWARDNDLDNYETLDGSTSEEKDGEDDFNASPEPPLAEEGEDERESEGMAPPLDDEPDADLEDVVLVKSGAPVPPWEEPDLEETPIDVAPAETTPKPVVEWRVFLVATNQYDRFGGERQLHYAENDVQELRKAFLNLGVPEDKITLLTGDGDSNGGVASYENILAKYDEFINALPDGAVAFVYFAGHGYSKLKNRVVQDVKLEDADPKDFDALFIPKDGALGKNCISINGELVAKLARSQARFKWICVDACRTIDEKDKEYFKGDFNGYNVMLSPAPPSGVLLTQSCTLGETAVEGWIYEHGVFSQSLINVLTGNARFDDGRRVATLREIRDYLATNVAKDVEAAAEEAKRRGRGDSVGPEQKPTFSVSNVPLKDEFEFWNVPLLTFNDDFVKTSGEETPRNDLASDETPVLKPSDSVRDPNETPKGETIVADEEPDVFLDDERTRNETQETPEGESADVVEGEPDVDVSPTAQESKTRDYRIIFLAILVVATLALVSRVMLARRSEKARASRESRRRKASKGQGARRRNQSQDGVGEQEDGAAISVKETEAPVCEEVAIRNETLSPTPVVDAEEIASTESQLEEPTLASTVMPTSLTQVAALETERVTAESSIQEDAETPETSETFNGDAPETEIALEQDANAATPQNCLDVMNAAPILLEETALQEDVGTRSDATDGREPDARDPVEATDDNLDERDETIDLTNDAEDVGDSSIDMDDESFSDAGFEESSDFSATGDSDGINSQSAAPLAPPVSGTNGSRIGRGVAPRLSVSIVESTRSAGEVLTLKILGQKTRFRWCPPGAFMMGSPESEEGRKANERQRRVTISRGFWIAEAPTNQSLWRSIMGANPSCFKGDALPVERVQWDQCVDFIDRLNSQGYAPEGSLFALPTEAEWEYACRAGTTTPFSFGAILNGVMANCDGRHPYGTDAQGYRHRSTTLPGLYAANPWGIYDMHGNVWEWCHDWFGEYMGDDVVDPQGPDSGVYRVVRGGSWHFYGRHCRSASRYCGKPHARKMELGFRLALLEIGGADGVRLE